LTTEPATASARLFLALWPAPSVRQTLAAQQARWSWPPGAARVAPESLHLTLHFIGPVPVADLARVSAGLQQTAASFELAFGRAELWPHGVAVLCPLEVPEALQDLHARLVEALGRLQLPVDARPFRPHVTFARKASGARPPAEPGPAWIWKAEAGYVLAQSAGGYRVLQHYPAA
jgi:2'-5' RNA ligase